MQALFLITPERTMITKILAAVTAVAAIVTPLAAQDPGMRRSAGGAPEGEFHPLTIHPVPYDPAHPFAGVWVGKLKTESGDVPYTIVIQFLNGAYDGFSSPGETPRNAVPHVGTAVARDTMRWEQANMGSGTLAFAMVALDKNTISGTMTAREKGGAHGTFTLTRRNPAK